MRVECENGNLGTRDAEVALEAFVHEHHFVEKQIVRECARHVLQGIMVGHDADTDAVADHHHQARAAELMGEILGVTREVEVGRLDIALVDRRGDEDVDLTCLEVGTSAVEAFAAQTPCNLCAFSKVYLDFLGGEVDKVELAFLRVGGVSD